MIGLDSYSRQVFNYLDPTLIYSRWIDCLFEICKIEVCFLWLSLSDHYRITDEALLAETTYYDPFPVLWMFSLLLKELILFLFALLFVYVFFRLLSILITLLGEEGAGLCAYRAFVC